ncbi:MAG: hypothetical protein ACRDE2_00095 [Chitinophagaceae bacterium]
MPDDLRISKLGVAFGRKYSGKTYTTWQMIYHYVTGDPYKGIKPRRALILDVNDEYGFLKAISVNDVGKFSNSRFIEARRIRAFNEKTGQPMTLNEVADCLFFILANYRRGLLLIEDINVYISDNLPDDLVGAICRNRHTELDIILHYQSIGRITTKVWQNINWLRFHKITDSVRRHKEKFEDKYEYLCIAENMVNNEYREGNKRFYCYIDVDEGKIRGDFSKKIFLDAIEIYLIRNYRTKIRPILDSVNKNGERTYSNYQDAFSFCSNDLLSQYSSF